MLASSSGSGQEGLGQLWGCTASQASGVLLARRGAGEAESEESAAATLQRWPRLCVAAGVTRRRLPPTSISSPVHEYTLIKNPQLMGQCTDTIAITQSANHYLHQW